MVYLLLIFTHSVCVILPDIWQFEAWNGFLAVSLDLLPFLSVFYQKYWQPTSSETWTTGTWKSCDWLAQVVCVFPVAYVSFWECWRRGEHETSLKSNSFYHNAGWFILLQSSFQTNLPVRWNIKSTIWSEDFINLVFLSDRFSRHAGS